MHQCISPVISTVLILSLPSPPLILESNPKIISPPGALTHAHSNPLPIPLQVCEIDRDIILQAVLFGLRDVLDMVSAADAGVRQLHLIAAASIRRTRLLERQARASSRSQLLAATVASSHRGATAYSSRTSPSAAAPQSPTPNRWRV